MKKTLNLLSPAKLNLFFRVLAKRSDGFHEIASLFQAINLADEISFRLCGEDHFTCTLPSLENPENLVVKARDLFRLKSKRNFHVAIQLNKKIPIRAGLGAGSSNAATTLWGINQLLGFPFSVQTLKLWAEKLGADVSFFLSKGSAYCTGKGEILQETILPSPITGFVAKPNFDLCTSLVYQHVHMHLLKNEIDPQEALESFLFCKPKFFNDLEKAAFHLRPQMHKIKLDLQNLGFHTVLMTGSGSSFFCLGDLKKPKLANVCFFPFVSIQRNSNTWYS